MQLGEQQERLCEDVDLPPPTRLTASSQQQERLWLRAGPQTSLTVFGCLDGWSRAQTPAVAVWLGLGFSDFPPVAGVLDG